MDYYTNIGEETVKKWNINAWWELVNKLDDLSESIALQETVGDTLEYAIITNSSKIIMCMREMLILTLHGYPDGALSIARTIYEYFIITKYLYDKKDDRALLDRYYEDRKYQAYKRNKEIFDYSLKNHDISDETYQKRIKKLLENLELDEAPVGTKPDYWWAYKERCKGFSGIQKSINRDAYYLRILYKRACTSIHASSIGSISLLGKDSKGGSVINTGTTSEGFSSVLLLGCYSLKEFFKIVCDHWKYEVDSDTDIYIEKILENYYNKIFKFHN